MKRFLLLFFAFYQSWVALSESDPCGTLRSSNYPGGNWNCSSDGRNVTFERFKILKLPLWSSDFPNEMRNLTIHDCETVELDPQYSNINYTMETLRFVNIKNLTISHTNDERNTTNSTATPQIRGTLNVTFENISFVAFKDPLIFKDLKNRTTYYNIVMNNVSVEYLKSKAIDLDYLESTLTITNSTFTTSATHSLMFGELRAKSVMIDNNTFSDLPKNAFKGQSDEFIFSRNNVTTVSMDFINIDSKVLNFTNNILNIVERYAFRSILHPNVLDPKNVNRIVKISRNTFGHVSFNASDTFGKGTFNNILIVSNNLFNCSCDNFGFFHSIREMENKSMMEEFSVNLESGNENGCINDTALYLRDIVNTLDNLCPHSNTTDNVCSVPEGQSAALPWSLFGIMFIVALSGLAFYLYKYYYGPRRQELLRLTSVDSNS